MEQPKSKCTGRATVALHNYPVVLSALPTANEFTLMNLAHRKPLACSLQQNPLIAEPSAIDVRSGGFGNGEVTALTMNNRLGHVLYTRKNYDSIDVIGCR